MNSDHQSLHGGPKSKFFVLLLASLKSLTRCLWFLPRDAMHKHGHICRHAVSFSLSVRLSVTFMDSVETNKHIFKIFSPSGSHSFSIPNVMAIFRREPSLTRASKARVVGKNRDSQPHLAIGSMTAGHASNNCDARPCSLSHRRRRFSESCLSQPTAWMTTTKRREQNRIQLYAAVNLKPK